MSRESSLPPALELARVCKRFGGVVALDDASLLVRRGTVHVVLGENGAGKTTLMHVAFGMIHPDSGVVRVNGRGQRLGSPSDAIAAGIGMVHQHFTLVPAMSVSENLALGGTGWLRRDQLIATVRHASELTGFAFDPHARVERLSVAAQQRVEIAKALVHDASVLILDEPTASLAPSEIESLLQWLRDYVSRGNSAVLITHKLHEALAVADDITVLRRGRVTLVASPRSHGTREITEAIVGDSLLDVPNQALPGAVSGSHVAFRAEHVDVRGPDDRLAVKDATFTIREGELVGVVGVEGAGQRELLRALAGRLPVSAGVFERPPRVGFVPEDRHQDAVLLDRPLAETMALRGAGERSGRMHWSAVRRHTEETMRDFDVRAPGATVTVRSLSGGNQQKLVLGRELTPTFDQPAPSALVVENPTRGLDLRAARDVQRRLRDASSRGATVVVYSSDLDEVTALASRVLVMFSGHLSDLPPDRTMIGAAMIGALPTNSIT